MALLLLILVCILSIEVFIQLNFLSLLESILKILRKATHLIRSDNISDNWKERIIPLYALRIMKHSLQLLLILLLIAFLFCISDFFFNGFFDVTISATGAMWSVIVSFGYVYLRKSLFK